MEKVIIYCKSGCRDSNKLKQLLNSNKINFAEKDITHDVHLTREMLERTGGRTATPQIFIHGKHLSNIEGIHKDINHLNQLLSRAA